jgi:hypothetical protein
MKITLIKNLSGVTGGCISTILGTAVCPMCGSKIPVEVANSGDQKESAWFIYHEKLGGGYCPGSEIDAIKLEKMAGLISEIKKLGFIVADIINRDPAGEAQKIIAYLLGRACYVVVDFSDGDFLEIEVTGQFLPDIISENKNDELFDNIPLNDKNSRGSQYTNGYCSDLLEKGFFCKGHKCKRQEISLALSSFLISTQDSLAEQFRCHYILMWFASACVCQSNSYDEETASAINRSVADKFPAEMFSADTELITEVR